MKANPGGQIDLRDVVGRDALIARIWDTLEQQSIRMTAERRIGKTTIIRKLVEEPRPGWLPIFQDLEQFHSAEDFALGVYQAVDRLLSAHKRTARRTREYLRAIGGMEVGKIIRLPELVGERSWREVLFRSVQDLAAERALRDQRPLFLWDELPYMLASIRDREGEARAMEVLDTLRALRQTHETAGLRMVLTGSIGLHHVLAALKRQGYANTPLNDTYLLEVPPLDPEAAQELATRLIAGEHLASDEPAQLAATIASESDGFPFYIHHIIKALKVSGQPASASGVRRIIATQLSAPHDPWELQHYRERIPVYYGQAREATVLALLDSLASRDTAASIDTLLQEARASGADPSREEVLELLLALAQDHYVQRDPQGRYHFRFPLLARWWRLARGL